ncbi:MAG: LysR family transcriptional regulator [Alphaproteobacteria bacterium]|nr:LysR family transcriptional regulator [Alphaproteobacteria bacterium]
MDERLRFRFRIMCGNEIAMGPGKADLLAAISETGSISGAARTLGMSYRRAWLLVDIMNRCWKVPLVQTLGGGRRGGGAKITEFGDQILLRYRQMEARATLALSAPDGEVWEITDGLRDQAKDSQKRRA